MENEKKKRHKKKKNKQGKANESAPAGVGELTSESDNHVNVTKRNHHNLDSETSNVQSKGLQQMVVDADRQPVNGSETALLKQKVQELQEQIDVHLEREADMERNISRSQQESNLWHHKEAELEIRVSQLQTEKGYWLQKEAGYEEKINQLVEEIASLRSMGVNFEEKLTGMEEEKVNLAQRENSTSETIASLSKDNTRLRAQVLELEASRSDISHQNQQLKELVSHLQSKLEDLENSVATTLSSEWTMHVAEYEDKKLQLESAHALVENLLSENGKLLEKVNMLNSVDEQKQSCLPDDPTVKADDDPMLSSDEKPVNVGSKDEVNSNDINSDSGGEIVRISLDMKPSVDEKVEVPLTEAPLIGAPFRLMSFVARYVSGADLVQKN